MTEARESTDGRSLDGERSAYLSIRPAVVLVEQRSGVVFVLCAAGHRDSEKHEEG